ncbi:MAG: methionine--tRNA ligase [Elusimicrobiota bacterium]|jgi:methionyl-tRNA synthetase|nr:methionine--tRNA ligase [Elusimicrobiota bacterium]
MKFYITTPIYYINDVPHIGHSYTTIAADIMARWKRLKGYDVFFVTGTDEHGAKIVAAAKENSKETQNFVDEMSEKFKEAWKLLNISNTDFIRTTDARHVKSVQNVIQTLFDKGFIYKNKYSALYCVGCEKFISEKDLDENGNCPDHKTKPQMKSEENYFFKLSKFQEPLLERILDPSHKEYIEIQPEERKNEIVGKLKLGLEDISVSRAALDWGIAVPFDKSQTIYVWIDALISYLTASYPDANDISKTYWPADIHLMAKDILWFHSVIWPAVLMAADLPIPKKVYSHGFFTIDSNKMSKTLGNVISPQELVDRFGIDEARYLTVSLIPFGSDGDISWSALTQKYNTDLANNLGNLTSRINKMLGKYFDFIIPQAAVNLSLFEKVRDILKKDFEPNMDSFQILKALEALQSALTLINQQIESDSPWKLVKTDMEKVKECLFSYIQTLDLILIHLLPFMPEISKKIWLINGANSDIEKTAKDYFANPLEKKIIFSQPQAKVCAAEVLFPRK